MCCLPEAIDVTATTNCSISVYTNNPWVATTLVGKISQIMQPSSAAVQLHLELSKSVSLP